MRRLDWQPALPWGAVRGPACEPSEDSSAEVGGGDGCRVRVFRPLIRAVEERDARGGKVTLSVM
jgi:hypothetical protein